MEDSLTLPGFVNAHTHTFQRALRGRAGGGDFWAWRELMLAEAERQTPDARPRRATRRRTGRCALRATPRSASSTTSASPKPTLRPRRLSRPESSSSSCSRRTRAAGFRGCGRNRWRGICEISKSCATRGSASASPPTPCVPARGTGSRSLAGTRPPRSCRCTFTRTSSRARSRSASPSTAAGRSSSSSAPAVSAR